jgi:hypothetical protein
MSLATSMREKMKVYKSLAGKIIGKRIFKNTEESFVVSLSFQVNTRIIL